MHFSLKIITKLKVERALFELRLVFSSSQALLSCILTIQGQPAQSASLHSWAGAWLFWLHADPHIIPFQTSVSIQNQTISSLKSNWKASIPGPPLGPAEEVGSEGNLKTIKTSIIQPAHGCVKHFTGKGISQSQENKQLLLVWDSAVSLNTPALGAPAGWK